jgi:hypothetical protein
VHSSSQPPRACHLGVATTQSIEHYWGLLQRVCHGNLTADRVSSGAFRAVELRLLCSILSVQHTQPGWARSSRAVLPPVLRIDWGSVPSLIWGCNAAFGFYALALHRDPRTTYRPPRFDALPRMLAWPTPQAFLDGYRRCPAWSGPSLAPRSSRLSASVDGVGSACPSNTASWRERAAGPRGQDGPRGNKFSRGSAVMGPPYHAVVRRPCP